MYHFQKYDEGLRYFLSGDCGQEASPVKKWLITVALVAYCLPGAAVAKNVQITVEEDQFKFVLANTVFVLLHELGHGLIHEFDLPVPGSIRKIHDQAGSKDRFPLRIVSGQEESPPSWSFFFRYVPD